MASDEIFNELSLKQSTPRKLESIENWGVWVKFDEMKSNITIETGSGRL